jgi:hypothetical protein
MCVKCTPVHIFHYANVLLCMPALSNKALTVCFLTFVSRSKMENINEKIAESSHLNSELNVAEASLPPNMEIYEYCRKYCLQVCLLSLVSDF